MTQWGSRIVGVGSYLPEKRVSNDELAEMHSLDTSDEWIVKRTGMKFRHFVAENEGASDMGFQAATRACENAGVKPSEVDAIILATSTPDNIFPATSAKIQAMMKTSGVAFDIQAVCAGFVFATAQADNMIRLGQAKNVMVIGSEVYSRILNWKDRSTCVLFGDGAGAILLTREELSTTYSMQRGILATKLHTDGLHYHDLFVDGGFASGKAKTGFVSMNGQEVFRHAVERMSGVVQELLEETKMEGESLDWYVPHQANLRAIDAIAIKMGLDKAKIAITIADHANVSSASIPIALDSLVKGNKIKKGDLLAMSALGGGFSWGGALVRW